MSSLFTTLWTDTTRWKRLLWFECRRTCRYTLMRSMAFSFRIWLGLLYQHGNHAFRFDLICVWRFYIGFQHVALGDKTHQWVSSWEINVSQCPSFVQTCYILIGGKVTVSTLQHAGLQEYRIFYSWKKALGLCSIYQHSFVIFSDLDGNAGGLDGYNIVFVLACRLPFCCPKTSIVQSCIDHLNCF